MKYREELIELYQHFSQQKVSIIKVRSGFFCEKVNMVEIQHLSLKGEVHEKGGTLPFISAICIYQF